MLRSNLRVAKFCRRDATIKVLEVSLARIFFGAETLL